MVSNGFWVGSDFQNESGWSDTSAMGIEYQIHDFVLVLASVFGDDNLDFAEVEALGELDAF